MQIFLQPSLMIFVNNSDHNCIKAPACPSNLSIKWISPHQVPILAQKKQFSPPQPEHEKPDMSHKLSEWVNRGLKCRGFVKQEFLETLWGKKTSSKMKWHTWTDITENMGAPALSVHPPADTQAVETTQDAAPNGTGNETENDHRCHSSSKRPDLGTCSSKQR